MDYSQFSDQALSELAKGKSADFSKFSDTELNTLAQHAPAAAEPDKITEEMHPDISYGDRAIVKNFSNSPEGSLAFLQKKYPNLQLKLGGDSGDRILAKRPEEQSWKTLDPDAGILQTLRHDPMEILKDLGDVGTDLASGVATGAATAAGGLFGALPGAMAAGGAAGAGTEFLRQKIGQGLGVNDDWKGGDVAASGAFGAAAPLLFGTGATAGQVAERAAAKAGAGATGDELLAAAKEVSEGQRGALGRLRDYFLPRVGAATSGVPADVIKAFADDPATLKALESSGVSDFLHAKGDQVGETLRNARGAVGQKIGDMLEKSGAPHIDLAGARAPMEELLQKLQTDRQKFGANKAIDSEISQVQEKIAELFHETKPGTPGTPGTAPSSLVGTNGQPLTPGTPGTPGTPPVSVPKASLDPRSAMNLKQRVDDVAQFVGMKPNAAGPRFAANATAFEKQLANAAAQSSTVLGDALDAASTGLGPNRQEYKRLMRVQQDMAPYFNSPEKIFSTLSNANNKTRQVLLERLQSFDKEFGTDLVESAKQLQVYKHFGGGGSLLPTSSGGTTSTSRSLLARAIGGPVGGLAGYQIGGAIAPDDHEARYLGAGAGAAVGATAASALGGPAAIRQAIQLYQSNAAQAARAAASGGYAPQSAWNFVTRGGASQ